jgi:hypothetical protein
MQVQTKEEGMQTTSHFRRVVATTAVLLLGALTLGASAGVAAQHEPKVGLGYPSQAAAQAIQGVRDVQIRDARHMALVDNARRHGLNVRNVKPIGSEQFDVPMGGAHGTGPKGKQERANQHDWHKGPIDFSPPPGTSAKVTDSVEDRGGFGWTYPGVLAGLSLAFALLAGGIVLVARRVKSRTVTA